MPGSNFSAIKQADEIVGTNCCRCGAVAETARGRFTTATCWAKDAERAAHHGAMAPSMLRQVIQL